MATDFSDLPGAAQPIAEPPATPHPLARLSAAALAELQRGLAAMAAMTEPTGLAPV